MIPNFRDYIVDVETHDFGTLTKFDVNSRQLRIYRGKPFGRMGRYSRDTVLVSLIIVGGVHKWTQVGSEFLSGGTIGILRNGNVENLQFSGRGATWLNFELDSANSRRVANAFARGQIDQFRSNDARILADAVQLLNVLSLRSQSRKQQQLILDKIVDGMFAVSDDFHERLIANRIQQYIEENYSTEISLIKICATIGCNLSHAGRAFKKKFGCTPGAYLRHVRFRRSFQLLTESNKPLIQIAHECGFCDESHFCRVFKRYTNLTPTACRRIYHPVVQKG